METLKIGPRTREFIDVAKKFASAHVSRIIQILILTRVVTPSTWAEDLAFAVNNRFAADLVLQVGTQRFYAHKVLSSETSDI